MATGVCIFVENQANGLTGFLEENGFKQYQAPSPRTLIFIKDGGREVSQAEFDSIRQGIQEKFGTAVKVSEFSTKPNYVPVSPDMGEPLSLL